MLIFCYNNKMARRVSKTKKKKKTYFKKYDLYSDANPKDTVRIRYKTKTDVRNTIRRLERLYKKKKITHARNVQIVNVMTQRLKVIKKRNPKIDKGRYSISKKYFEKLKKRTKSRKNKKSKKRKISKRRRSKKRKISKRRRSKRRRSKRRNRVTGRVLRGIGNVVRKVPSTMITKGKNISKISDKKAIERLKDAYELDDKYREKLKQMYWKKKPIYYRNPNNLRSFRIRRK